MDKSKEKFGNYITEMNKVSALLVAGGVFFAAVALTGALVLYLASPGFESPMAAVILSETWFRAGTLTALTAPAVGFVSDLFAKALRRKRG